MALQLTVTDLQNPADTFTENPAKSGPPLTPRPNPDALYHQTIVKQSNAYQRFYSETIPWMTNYPNIATDNANKRRRSVSNTATDAAASHE